MADTARLQIGDQSVELPIVEGSEDEKALDISALRSETGHITLDQGYGNTGSCQSGITFIDGDKGILRYRGYGIEDLSEHSNFIETSYLLIWGELPTAAQLEEFSDLLTKHQMLREGLKHHFNLFPPNSPPMAVLSSVLNALSCYYPELLEIEDDEEDEINQGLPQTTYIYDVRDLDAPTFVARHTSGLESIDHNQYVNGSFVFQSNYCSGLQVLAIDESGEHPVLSRAGYLDNAPDCDTPQFSGSWSNFPYFASGNIVFTSIERGLYVADASAAMEAAIRDGKAKKHKKGE